MVPCGCDRGSHPVQSDMAFKQKQRDDKKKLAEAQARAGQKGPMGEFVSGTGAWAPWLAVPAGGTGIKKSGKK